MTKTFSPSHFLEAIGISGIRIKREDIGKMLPICISDDLLNMCSEPFVTALGVRDACLASMKVKSVASSYGAFDRTVDPW